MRPRAMRKTTRPARETALTLTCERRRKPDAAATCSLDEPGSVRARTDPRGDRLPRDPAPRDGWHGERLRRRGHHRREAVRAEDAASSARVTRGPRAPHAGRGAIAREAPAPEHRRRDHGWRHDR